jgi:dolichyl-phosphate beta-glucosyltransferase
MKLSIIIPAYNEQGRIGTTLRSIDSYLRYQPFDYQIIVAVNGSTDKTLAVAQNSRWIIKNLKVINLPQAGKGNAVRQAALNYSDSDYVLFMDADNATPVSEIERLLPLFEQGYDVVFGSRYLDAAVMEKRPPLLRMILSRLSNYLIRLFAVPKVSDTQLGFKMFSRRSAYPIFRLSSINGWLFDVELLAIALAQGYKIKEVPVKWSEPGGSHISLSAYLRSLIDLFKIAFSNLRGLYTGRAKQTIREKIAALGQNNRLLKGPNYGRRALRQS